ncbi:predicted protein [Postia placenta Mad-698-R]|nr:predicted protein [Postia placenta Mad-698-R]
MEFELPEVEEVSDYEEQCSLTRARNKTFLESLNLDAPAFVPKVAKKPRAPRKRKVSALHSPEPQRKSKVARVESSEDGSANTGLRRSGRNQGKKVDYASDNIGHAMPRLASVQAGLREMVTEPRSLNKRMHDPKTFGTIPGVPVGSWWLTREECSADAIHAPWVAGISGGPDGAYSIALSGGYEDDVDLGEAFTYTGAGGRDLKGTKTNPKNAWMEKGLNPHGFKVCKFAFKRVSGQLSLAEILEGTGEASSQNDEDAEDTSQATSN